MSTATAGSTHLAELAKAAGYKSAVTVDTLEGFERAFTDSLAASGPNYIHAKVENIPMPDVPVKSYGTVEEAISFRRALIKRGWIGAGHAGVSTGKWLAPDERQASSHVPGIELASESGPRPSLEKAKIIYSSLKKAGLDFFVYLPDSANYLIQRMAEVDPDVINVSVSREDDGLAIAMGAFMGGRNPVLIMEASGLGLCTLAFSILAHEQRMACLILFGHNFALGEVRDVHACTRWVADPVLDALRIPHLTLMATKDAPLIIQQAWRTVRGQMCPVAISLPIHTIWDE
jgi:sulfopyruvate decarboxylase TPP-binding subunit